jgi:hypothetical protein
MHRTSIMALGFFLIFLGVQLNVVERYVMTPRMANLMSADGTLRSAIREPINNVRNANKTYESPYYQASYQTPTTISSFSPAAREIRPPRWLCWPVLFLGAVVLINGLTLRRG